MAVTVPAVTVAAPQPLCTVDDPRLAELSGLVADGSGLWAMTDGGRRVEVHRLDHTTCAVTETRRADIDPFDAEDLARGRDGALWVADTGDNDRTRDSVAVVVLPKRGKGVLHRLTYPDGPHDAEALLVDAEQRPLLITKEIGNQAGIYRTDTAPEGAGPIPLTKVGTVSLPASDTEGGPLGGIGSRLVTGAAATPDGRLVALRTYTDAWLFPVVDGDVVAALRGEPIRVPLPGEPQGEAITFDEDGTLISGSETRGGVPGELRVVPGAAALVPVGASVVPASGTPTPEPEPAPTWLPAAVGGGVAVLALVVLMLAMTLRGRRR
ncbi:esterase-like activity of phytase family protein [Pseudonocardia sp. TRM90224]|uniref:esterase-like activity of phytase family protein n=1 Tax=Pseudonocardia sp. TRM90224 TaxID=2812678 RepID=UPI001E5DA046|nr:esterase-like activity of phytase family protein [Pseudonocardia sp. TRM90224]